MLAIILASVTLVYGYGKLNHRVETLETQAKESVDTRERVIRIEEGVVYLKDAVKRIEAKLE